MKIESKAKRHRPRKRFAQNFLVDQSIIHKIIEAIHVQPEDHVVEIGPGRGALTRGLIASGCTLDLIELDRDLATSLAADWQNNSTTVHQADILKIDISTLRKSSKLRLIGNLPYNISTPLLFHLFEFLDHIQDMYFMLQHEVVQRLIAEPSSKSYGRLSVMCQYHCEIERKFAVPPTSFRPAPKVHSAVVRLLPHKHKPQQALDTGMLEKVVSRAFNQRRKTLRNSPKEIRIDLEALHIDAGLRPENLHIEDYVRIANYLTDAGAKL